MTGESMARGEHGWGESMAGGRACLGGEHDLGEHDWGRAWLGESMTGESMAGEEHG